MKNIAVALLFFSTSAIADECKFKTPNAIVCTTAEAAAYSYQAFGFDIRRTNIDYNRKMLQDSGCGRTYANTYKTDDVRGYVEGKLATPSGWVRVRQIIINDTGAGFVASEYLSCKHQEDKARN
ncbi:hypothetical protein [Cupriavidus sp. D39]|uniref:hypothetical protein n=1 Tax=Cupriavidus sp. D39 TaxID=2997877 RepID=UPI00226EA2F8|nr:hypothetical protein [Cupriavidus sp. D39]MCY0854345.1 hypothetical protein [Cupriavidus sp. D39]